MNPDLILLNNLFNGKYIKNKVGGEIINLYQSDNGNYYIYANPYGNIDKKRDNRIKHILFIRSVGNKVVKVIAKVEVECQICCNAKFQSKKEDRNKNIEYYSKKKQEQINYIDNNKITYGGVKLYNLGSWSEYFVTFKAKTIYKASTDIYLALDENQHIMYNTTILHNVKKINNQSQKKYIDSTDENYKSLIKIIKNKDFWEDKPVGLVSLQKKSENNESFLSIIKKENDELVNSNLLAYFLENDHKFWSIFVEEVLKIKDSKIINGFPKITRESFNNIDLFIEVEKSVIVIENKIKSRINGLKRKGYSQLEKYVIEVEKKFKGSKYFLLRPNYNNENYKKFDKNNDYKEIKYSAIYDIVKNWESNFHFEEFKRVLKKHSSEYDNEMFEVMNERFIQQINNKLKQMTSNKNK
ncbi:MAG: PD-(D/E)XK nuclease family protein [Candidatus Cloacimonetes bacterium]|nr:PD-(D/E)XK nuclease family protein [Candidatus Cloacimonadota bacterium]